MRSLPGGGELFGARLGRFMFALGFLESFVCDGDGVAGLLRWWVNG